MCLQTRLTRLEQSRPRSCTGARCGVTHLPPDLLARIAPARAAGTFPQSVATADLRAILDLTDAQGAA